MNLRLLQLGDSALPIGGYSHSWGLEAAIDRGLVRDPAGLEQWTRHWLRQAVGPLEGVVVAASARAAGCGDWAAVRQANELVAASVTPPTLRHASRDMGEQLLGLVEVWPWAAATAAALREVDAGEWHHASVFGALSAAAGGSTEEAVAVFLHQAAMGLIGAGVRGIPIGHTHGQQVLARLHDDVRALAATLGERSLQSAGSFCPAYEVYCDAQAALYTRLFRS
jgi:urease accessory protein